MGFFRKIAGLLGLNRDEVSKDAEEDEEENGNPTSDDSSYPPSGLRRRGFSVPIQVPIDRPNFGPVLVSCGTGDGGVQVCLVVSFIRIWKLLTYFSYLFFLFKMHRCCFSLVM